MVDFILNVLIKRMYIVKGTTPGGKWNLLCWGQWGPVKNTDLSYFAQQMK